MKALVCGFLFLDDGREVVLIQKGKPEWMQGKLNGVGGHVEPCDATPLYTMRREWKEKTGEDRLNWDEFLELDFKDSIIYFFRAFDNISTAKTNEVEMVVRADVETLSGKLMVCHFGNEEFLIEPLPNLRYLIPMALSGDTGVMRQ